MHDVIRSGKWQLADGRYRFATCQFLLVTLLLLSACSQSLPDTIRETRAPLTVTLDVDGEQQTVTTVATTVREVLEEADVILNDIDEVIPPPFTPVADNLIITVVRVTESLEIIPQSIPFGRKIVRNETMEADDPPLIIQTGKTGLQEQTVRIVFRDGLETERFTTQVTVIEPARDEIMMVGIGAAQGNVNFSGLLAYVSGGQSLILRGSTAFPEQINTGGNLDGRVFRLSPSGEQLLYTRIISNTGRFNNSLWVISTEPQARPRPLGIRNVLWADWDPTAVSLPKIAYTTAAPTDLPPGWEANNDLWLGEVVRDETADFEPTQLIESYPATYGWWGGNFAWSPQGRRIAYSYANEIGVIDTEARSVAARRTELQRFTEYNTLSDWVWVPTLSWSANGRYLAFTNHGSTDPEELLFDSWVVDAESGLGGQFVTQSGMWSHLHWSTTITPTLNNSQIAFLKATDPLNSQRSSYTLWLMDGDGSNSRQVYPPQGENSRFPREQQAVVWGPTGQDLAFIFNDALHIMNIETGEAFPITQDDAVSSHPTWAPYGAALAPDLDAAEPGIVPLPTQSPFE
ncbi:MAG: ubiquitin-like domain-containing protein [Chloroflexota bacterium]